jgi:hypothetical protein
LNDKSLFGILNTDRNLLDEGTLLLDPTSITVPILMKIIKFFMRLLLMIMLLMTRAAMMNQKHQVIQPCLLV